jgi:hypothetical protein
VINTRTSSPQADPLISVYLRAERVVQLSLLSIIFRLSPIAERPFENISFDSLDVSRKALDAHGRSVDELCTVTHENDVVNRLFNKFVYLAPNPSDSYDVKSHPPIQMASL